MQARLATLERYRQRAIIREALSIIDRNYAPGDTLTSIGMARMVAERTSYPTDPKEMSVILQGIETHVPHISLLQLNENEFLLEEQK